MAYVEIAHLFLCRKYTLAKLTPKDTFGKLAQLVKRWCNAIFTQTDQCLLPGQHCPEHCHPCGRALPKGMIQGARPLLSEHELRHFARLLLDGAGRTLKTWDFSFADHGA